MTRAKVASFKGEHICSQRLKHLKEKLCNVVRKRALRFDY